MIGETIFHYKITGEIGQGGMGEVFSGPGVVKVRVSTDRRIGDFHSEISQAADMALEVLRPILPDEKIRLGFPGSAVAVG